MIINCYHYHHDHSHSPWSSASSSPHSSFVVIINIIIAIIITLIIIMIITSVFFCHHQLSYHHQLSVKSSFQMLQQACKLLTLDTPGNLIMCALGKLIFHSNLSIIYLSINIFLYLSIYL